MSLVTLKDVSLTEYNLDNLDLLQRLRKRLLRDKAEVCIERSKFITKYMRDLSSDMDPTEIRYAKAVNYFLSKKQPLYFDENFIAGTTTSKPFGAPVYPEFTGLAVWPELDTISTRAKNPQKLSIEDARVLNLEIFPYWMERNILESTRKRHQNPECLRLFEKLVFFIAGKAGCISHTVPNYKVVLQKGVDFIIDDAAEKEARIKKSRSLTKNDKQKLIFYQAVQIAMEGVIAYARNLSERASELSEIEQDPSKKANLLNIAEVCNQVPAMPARNFREAINAIWIIHVAIHAENINMAMSPGRLDQLLFPYFKQDITKGLLSIKQAIELVGCLWLKFNDNTNLVPETSEELFGGAGTVPAVTVGGIDGNGNDAVNDLTYIMLRVTEMLQTRDPNLNARYHFRKNSQIYRNRIAEVIARTGAGPAVHNDVVDIMTLRNQGIEPRHARDFAIIGCVELASAGRSFDASSAIILNLVSVFELTLFNGKKPETGDEQVGPETGNPSTFINYEEFWEAFKKQFSWLAGKAIELNEYFGLIHQENMPLPLLSSFFEGPMQKGKDLLHGGALYNSSGATHIGFADTVDSLNAIEKAVFIEKKCTFSELLMALQDDFIGHERLHSYLTNKSPKYGTQDPIAVKNSQNLIRFIYEFYQSHVNYRGGRYRPAFWTMTNHAGLGKLTRALPNGRTSSKPFASGITPSKNATSNLSACLKAVGGLDSKCIPGGVALNLKFPTVNGKSDVEKLAQAIEAYFRIGGLQVQFNIISYNTLIDAKNNPEKYPELLVRVSGYSAYYKDLTDAMKDEIITRIEYKLLTGESVPLPREYFSSEHLLRPTF